MALLGNPTFSGRVTKTDAQFIFNVLQYINDYGVLLTEIATGEQLEASDTNGDGRYLNVDGNLINEYNAYLYNGGTLDLASWRDAGKPKYDDN